MATVKELVDEVHEDKNAVSAALKGLEGIGAFTTDLMAKVETGDMESIRVGLSNIAYLAKELVKAVPANVTPASAGPVGQSPHEQYLEQAASIVHESLEKMGEAAKGVHEILAGINEALNHAVRASAAIQSPDLKAKP